ncbi:ATP-binding cassette domain-containing protein [Embleya sp. NPDC005971]|uniref:ATP-binding cassette domain-containing protein n=1 Tax=Embleya sp. NPDC005971 TaxID=3156724 RepID=UPI00340657E3
MSVTYPGADRPALAELSLSIPHRGHIAIVGRSGAGKTTIFSLLSRFHEPDSGRIEMAGAPYERLSIGAVRARIAYVEQETPLLAGTVRDNVLFRHPDAGDEQAWAALRAVRLDETVRRLPGGLDEPVAGTSLSGGERRRIAVARAVVRRPDVLLPDEATAQLDGRTEAAIHDVMRQVARHGAVVTIAHRLSTVVDRGPHRADGRRPTPGQWHARPTPGHRRAVQGTGRGSAHRHRADDRHSAAGCRDTRPGRVRRRPARPRLGGGGRDFEVGGNPLGGWAS